MIAQQNLTAQSSFNFKAPRPYLAELLAIDRTNDTTTFEEPGAGDSIQVTNNAASSWTEYRVNTQLGDNPIITIGNPAVATVNGTIIEKNGAGGSTYAKIGDGYRHKVFPINTYEEMKSVSYFERHTDNSLSKLLADNFLDLVVPGKQQNLYSGYNPSANTFTLNPNCVVAGFDFSGVAVATTLYGPWGNRNRGGLITPQHVVGAVHYKGYTGYTIGDQFKFRGADGTIHTRTIVGKYANYGDLVIVTLDSPLPTSPAPDACKVFKLAGDWMYSEVTTTPYSLTGYLGGLSFYLDQNFNTWYQTLGGGNKLTNVSSPENLVLEGVSCGRAIRSFWHNTSYYLQTRMPGMLSGKSTWLREAVGGDSGSPVMVIINNEPILLGVWWYSNDCMATGTANGAVANRHIELADADALTRNPSFNGGAPTGYTVTVAPDPTL